MWVKRCSIFLFLLNISLAVFPQGKKAETQPVLSADSIIENDKNFSYVVSLDSLLRERNALADSLSKIQKPVRPAKTPFLIKLMKSPIVRVIFWGLLAVLVSVILYRLFDFNIPRRRKVGKGVESDDEAELETPDWYASKIAEAEKDNDFRLAFRYRFKRLLALLSEEGLIYYLPEKTNQAYLSELENEVTMKDVFKKVSSAYEYVWYGKIELTPQQYEHVKKLFSEFKATRI